MAVVNPEVSKSGKRKFGLWWLKESYGMAPYISSRKIACTDFVTAMMAFLSPLRLI